MKRIPEPELMNDEKQARAYADADFDEPHNRFIELFREAFPGFEAGGFVLDLGCGPGDIAVRFARAFSACTVHGIDGAGAMLRCGWERLGQASDIAGRVELIHGMLPGANLPRPRYDAVISNSLLHHLAEPSIIWQTVKTRAAPGAAVFIVDLLRPQTESEAYRLVDVYMQDEPEILRRDFYNSLVAAYTVREVRAQLEAAGLGYLASKQVSDRHLAVWGKMDNRQ
jgi:ubiquinone/menaquinone biosynthesis C-methylase UbiE